MNIKRYLQLVALIAAALVLGPRPALAEDIQIYIEGPDESAGANVLFLLETAGQVNANFDTGGGNSVSEEMFEAMEMVVNQLSGNMRVGVAAQNRGGTDGGHIGFPIVSLEQRSDPVARSRVYETGEVETGGDAVQDFDKIEGILEPQPVDVESDTMPLPYASHASHIHNDSARMTAFRFDEVAVPSWAVVENAYIELRSPTTGFGTYEADMHFQEDGAEVFSEANDLAARAWSETTTEALERDGNAIRVDVTQTVQDAVSRSDWCGRENLSLAMSRTSFSEGNEPEVYSARAQNEDGNRLGQPRLVVEWSATGSHEQPAGEPSCMGGVRLSINADADDGSESLADGGVVTSAEQLQIGRNHGNDVSGLDNNENYLSGVRFSGVPFGSGTTVSEATLHMRVDEGNPMEIRPMLGNVDAFGASHSISSMPTGSVTTVDPAEGDFSIDVTASVQEIFESTGWSEGGAMGFRFDAVTPGDQNENAKVQARRGGSAPVYLTLSVSSAEPGDFAMAINRRDEVHDALADMQSGAGGGNTKTGSAYVENARFLEELSPRTGDQPYAHDDAFVDDSRSRYAGVNLGPGECGGETHVIMISNKDPNGQDLESAQQGYNQLSGEECEISNDGWTCIQSTAGYMRSNNITTHAVNFAPDPDLEEKMQEVARRGGGEYRFASSAHELAAVVADILDSIIISDASMAAPGVAVNQLNRFRHLDQLYYALFRPSLDTRWDGNLKRYKLDFDQDPPQIVDSHGAPAVDEETGFFRSSSNSWWGDRDDGTNLPDGSDVTLGGAREELNFGDMRRLLYADSLPEPGLDPSASSPPAGLGMYQLMSSNDVTTDQLGMDPDSTQEEVDQRVEFLLGGWGDPLHSEPRLVNYGFEGSFQEASLDPSLQDNVVFVTTNDGMLHAIDPENGEEIFSFMPPDEMVKADLRFRGGKLDADDPQRHTYGLDGGITAWRQAKDDGSGEAEHVLLYLGQRRGGRNYYALDVTDRQDPRLLWAIQGGEGDFGSLGQTWAAPTLAQIRLNGQRTPVLIMSGGYSPEDHDTTGEVSTGDEMGNGIYIVNANNGALIWSVSDTGGTVEHADMKWAMPAGVSVVDINFDGITDYLYAVDLGGQVFRVDLNSNNTGAHGLAYRVVTLAQLGTSGPGGGGIEDHRRFHAAPVVALGERDGENLLQVSLGSGYRSHPLNMDTDDRVYMLDDTDALNALNSTFDPSPAITEGDLLDVTNDTSPEPEDFEGKHGWMIRLENGEKVMSSSVVMDGTIFVSSYLPETAYEDPCQRVVGLSRLYGLSLSDGSPVFSPDETSDDGDTVDGGELERFKELVLPGLPPSPQVLLGPEGQQTVLVGTASVDPELDTDFSLRRSRWFEINDKSEADALLQATMHGEDDGGGEEEEQ